MSTDDHFLFVLIFLSFFLPPFLSCFLIFFHHSILFSVFLCFSLRLFVCFFLFFVLFRCVRQEHISIKGLVRPSVRPSVCLSVRPSVRPSIIHTLLFLGFCGLWPHCSCPNDLVTSNTAPAHPSATGIGRVSSLVISFSQNNQKSQFWLNLWYLKYCKI